MLHGRRRVWVATGGPAGLRSEGGGDNGAKGGAGVRAGVVVAGAGVGQQGSTCMFYAACATRLAALLGAWTTGSPVPTTTTQTMVLMLVAYNKGCKQACWRNN